MWRDTGAKGSMSRLLSDGPSVPSAQPGKGGDGVLRASCTWQALLVIVRWRQQAQIYIGMLNHPRLKLNGNRSKVRLWQDQKWLQPSSQDLMIAQAWQAVGFSMIRVHASSKRLTTQAVVLLPSHGSKHHKRNKRNKEQSKVIVRG